MPINTLPETLPWYRSKVIFGSILAVAGPVLKALGLIDQWTGADGEALADLIVAATTAAGGLIATVARLRQKAAPAITATKKG